MKRRDSRRGFSLIELLTVIAIIAILAAIVFPVMTKVKENAREHQCMTNLHGIAMGLQMFKQDNRRYPTILGSEAYGRPDTNGVRTRVTEGGTPPDMFENVKDAYLFAEYVKTIQGFHCPSSPINDSKAVAYYDRTGQAVGTTPMIAVYAYDSYDCSVKGQGGTGPFKEFSEGRGTVDRHYVTNWAIDIPSVDTYNPYPPGSGDKGDLVTQKIDYARQLKFRNPPGDTLVTWCSYHEGVSLKGKVLAVFLDGTASTFPAGEFEQCRWRVKPKKS